MHWFVEYVNTFLACYTFLLKFNIHIHNSFNIELFVISYSAFKERIKITKICIMFKKKDKNK